MWRCLHIKYCHLLVNPGYYLLYFTYVLTLNMFTLVVNDDPRSDITLVADFRLSPLNDRL